MTTRNRRLAPAVVAAIGMLATSSLAGLVPGGGPGTSDCYVELDVAGIENGTERVVKGKKVLCTDGEACDTGECGDGVCDMAVTLCWNQTDPNLPSCTAPATLDRLKVKGKLGVQVPQLLEGAACLASPVAARIATRRKGKKVKPGTLKLSLQGKAPKGTKPRTDTDRIQLQCLPRTVECPPATTSTTTVTLDSTTITTTTSTTSTTLASLCAGDPNGVVEGSEQCDDGNVIDGDGCSSRCTCCGEPADEGPVCLAPAHPVTTTPNETCDDGNFVSGDGCDANCTVTGCGNLVVTSPETCDDGNFDDNDDCPGDCIVDACAAETGTDEVVTVVFTGVGGAAVGGLTVLLDFPEGKVAVPGFGVPATEDITDNPVDTLLTAQDLEHAVRVAVINTFSDAIPTGTLFKVHFETCTGASAPAVGEFACRVLDAFAPDGVTAVAATCAVTIP